MKYSEKLVELNGNMLTPIEDDHQGKSREMKARIPPAAEISAVFHNSYGFNSQDAYAFGWTYTSVV